MICCASCPISSKSIMCKWLGNFSTDFSTSSYFCIRHDWVFNLSLIYNCFLILFTFISFSVFCTTIMSTLSPRKNQHNTGIANDNPIPYSTT